MLHQVHLSPLGGFDVMSRPGITDTASDRTSKYVPVVIARVHFVQPLSVADVWDG